MSPIVVLLVQLIPLSFVAFGGVQSVFPEIQRIAVDLEGWMTARQFSELFAISQAAPGPNVVVVTLVGGMAAGVGGALVATVALLGPSSVLAYVVACWRSRIERSRWHETVRVGMAPVTVGFVAASAYVIVRGADQSIAAGLVTAAAAALTYATKVHPLWLIAAGAALGFAGLVPS